MVLLVDQQSSVLPTDLQVISLICTNRPGVAQLNYFTADVADQPGGSGAAGAVAEAQRAAAVAERSKEGGEERRPNKRQRKGKEKVGEQPAGTSAAAAGAAAGGKGGGKGQSKLQQEAQERAAAQEAPPSLPAAGGPRGTLIVCPLSVVSNWQMQIEEHTAGNLSGGWAEGGWCGWLLRQADGEGGWSWAVRGSPCGCVDATACCHSCLEAICFSHSHSHSLPQCACTMAPTATSACRC